MSTRVGTWAAALAVVMLVSSCGDAPFAELGRVDRWVDEGAEDGTPVQVVTTTLPEGVPRSIGAVVWYNGWARTVSADSETLIAEVWARTDGSDAYVQSSPNEIAAALPGIMVPGEVPAEVESVTSQLVYARSKGNLTNFFVAAFGFWMVEPYTASSQVGQAATLKVAFEQEQPRDVTDPTGGCARFDDVTSCDPFEVNGHPAWWTVSLDGEALILLQGAYRYEYTLRPQFERADVEAMALSMVPLSSVTPNDATMAVEPVGAGFPAGESSG